MLRAARSASRARRGLPLHGYSTEGTLWTKGAMPGASPGAGPAALLSPSPLAASSSPLSSLPQSAAAYAGLRDAGREVRGALWPAFGAYRRPTWHGGAEPLRESTALAQTDLAPARTLLQYLRSPHFLACCSPLGQAQPLTAPSLTQGTPVPAFPSSAPFEAFSLSTSQRWLSSPATPSPASSSARAGAASSSSVTSSAALAPRSGLAAWYLGMLERRPIATKAVTACGIFTVADVISQHLTFLLDPPTSSPLGASPSTSPPLPRSPPSSPMPAFHWDMARTLRMSAAGLILSGPTLHFWYGFMARWRPGTDFPSIFQKIFVGTVFYGPPFNAIFFSCNGALQGEGKEEIMGRLRRDLLPTLVNGLMYWPFCDVLTYRFVPVHLQCMECFTIPGASPVGSNWAPRSTEVDTALERHGTSRPGTSPWQVEGQLVSLAQAWGYGDSPMHRPRGGLSASSAPHPAIALHCRSLLSAATSAGPASLTRSSPFSGLPAFPSSSALIRGRGPAWAEAGSARAYVQLQTLLDVADNSGAKKVKCIKVLKGGKPNAASVGDVIIASVKAADFHGKVKKGDVVTCIVVRSAMAKRRVDGSLVRFDGPAAVVINKAGEPIGTRVFGAVPHELRLKKLVKVLALAQQVA